MLQVIFKAEDRSFPSKTIVVSPVLVMKIGKVLLEGKDLK